MSDIIEHSSGGRRKPNSYIAQCCVDTLKFDLPQILIKVNGPALTVVPRTEDVVDDDVCIVMICPGCHLFSAREILRREK